MNEHVILIGFMCSGKSTVGRELARLEQLPFIDLDREVEKRVGPLLPFIQLKGEAAFREEERSELIRALDMVPHVIATGGGTPTEGDNMERMKQKGVIVLLEPSRAELLRRIERAGGDRPLLFGLKGAELHARVDELLAARAPVYATAHLKVDGDGSAVEVAQRVHAALHQRR